MSKSKANEILQELYAKMVVKWTGIKTDFTAEKAYELCKRIVEESEKDD